MDDITPGLIQAITEEFNRLYDESNRIQVLMRKVRDGTATCSEAYDYSIEVSRLIGKAYAKHISSAVLPDGRMLYHIASRLIPANLDKNYQLVRDYAQRVQQALNQQAGIGLKAQAAEKNQDRIDGLVDLASDAGQYDDISSKLTSAFENFSQNIVDETIRKNAEFHYRAGLRPKIIRRAERKCCKWCSSLEGEYNYPLVPPDVYRRHERCRCTVDYNPGNGKVQNVHTKQWKSEEEYAKLTARKQFGVTSLAKSLADHPKRLASFTPASLKAKLEADGLEVKPLKKGSLKNIPFADGGGYKVNFEDGGLLQYHPAARSHHGGAYYKISTGKGGTHRYDLEGNETDG